MAHLVARLIQEEGASCRGNSYKQDRDNDHLDNCVSALLVQNTGHWFPAFRRTAPKYLPFAGRLAFPGIVYC